MSETLIATDEERNQPANEDAPSTAELAECTCPDFCERDHENE